MRIAYVVPGFSAHDDDPCIPVLLDVLSRVSDSADVHVLALRYPAPRRRYTLRGIQIHALGGDERGGLSRIPLLLSAVLALWTEHRRRPFDIVHGLWADEPGAVAVAAGRLLGIPSAVSVMGGELVALPALGYGGALSRANRLLSRYALRHAGAVTAASLASISGVETTHANIPDSKARRLVWGIDPEVFVQPPSPLSLSGDFRILHVGSLVPVKGVHLLLRAAACAARVVPGLHVHLVGDGFERAALLALAAEPGLQERVTMHGQVPRERLGDFYGAADVLCVSSWHEMQPVVALEAGLFGLPVIGTAVGLLPDLVSDDAITTPGDVDAMASALVSVAGDGRGPRLGAALQSHVSSQCLARHTAQQLARLYTELCRPASQEAARRHAGSSGNLHDGALGSRLAVTASVVNDVSDD